MQLLLEAGVDVNHNDPVYYAVSNGHKEVVELLYTVVGKGKAKAFVPDLLHEGEIFKRLARLQRTAVLVYLGNINLKEWYYLDVGVRIQHILLMSWGGNLADENESMKDPSELQKEIKRTVAEIGRAGVNQMDVRSLNLLWNREAQRVMLIDFERAAVTKLRTEYS